jgi:hypothetical protein
LGDIIFCGSAAEGLSLNFENKNGNKNPLDKDSRPKIVESIQDKRTRLLVKQLESSNTIPFRIQKGNKPSLTKLNSFDS